MNPDGPVFSEFIPWPASLTADARAILDREFEGLNGEGEWSGAKAVDISFKSHDLASDMEKLSTLMNALVECKCICGTRMGPCLVTDNSGGNSRRELTMRVMAAPGQVDACTEFIRVAGMLWEPR